MSHFNPFSPSYQIARDRFRQAASRLNARLEKFSIGSKGPEGEDLTIDVAFIGNTQSNSSVVVSSGLHGIEGFLGSAIQLAWMMDLKEKETLQDRSSFVLIHAINPFGFAWLRRCNEENVDLSRNFLGPNEPYLGGPPGYRKLNGLLNPTSPPSLLDSFRIKAMWNICYHGIKTLKSSIASGQYEFETGLFFGGHCPAKSTHIFQKMFSQWIAKAKDIVHVDLHSGLGKFSQYKLLLVEPHDSPHINWYSRQFGPDLVEPSSGNIAYPAKGMMGSWLTGELSGRRYRFICAEFGTYPIIRVLGALRAENRTHFHSKTNLPEYERTKKELLECFCPKSPLWRQTVIKHGTQIIRTATSASTSMCN